MSSPASPRARVLVVGGGFTGLTAAHDLARRGLAVELWERGDSTGGLAADFSLAGYPLEKAYHCLFTGDRDIVALAGEIGLADQLIWPTSSTGIYHGGRLWPFNSPLDLLRYAPCRFLDRLRTGLTVLRLKRSPDWRPLAGETAENWMRRHCGESAMDTIWRPLLRGKFAQHANDVAMSWLWGRLHVRANSRHRGAERFGYFRGGFGIVARRLEELITAAGGVVRTDAPLAQLVRRPDGRIDARRPGLAAPETFDRVLFTGSSRALRELLAGDSATPPAYLAQLAAVPYLGAAMLVFVSRQKLPAPFWLNINEPGAPFLVFVRHTALAPASLYGGHEVYYIGTYTDHAGPAMTMPEERLREEWLAYAARIFPQLDRAQIVDSRVLRLRDAQHVVRVGHEQVIPDYRTPVPGLWLANYTQIHPEDRGTNYSVREGRKVAALLAADLGA